MNRKIIAVTVGLATVLALSACHNSIEESKMVNETHETIIHKAPTVKYEEETVVTQPVETEESTEPLTEPTENTKPSEAPTEEIIEQTQTEPEKYFTEEEIRMVAKVMWHECRGVYSTTEKACVAWVIVNRVDAGYANTISGVITAPGQFAWDSYATVTDELYSLAEDVLTRWNNEKNGDQNVGRVLPSNFLYFSGDGARNYFRNKYSGGYAIWDYSLPSPYEN